MGAILRKYAAAAQIDGICLITKGEMDYKANPTLAAGDVTISKDGGAFASIEGAGTFGDFVAVAPAAGTSVQLKPDATAMTCKTLVIKLADQTTPKEWEDQLVRVETYGHASAMHVFDLGTAIQKVDVETIKTQAVTCSAGVTVGAKVGAAEVILFTGTGASAKVNAQIQGTDDIDLSATQKLSVNAEVDTALTDLHLDHLLAASYDPAAKPGNVSGLLNIIVENDAGVPRFTANSLEQAPAIAPPAAASIADAVWDELLAAHNIKKSAADYVKKGGGGSTVTLFAGTAQAGGPLTITLAIDVPAIANLLNQNLIVITGGTGVGQTRRIVAYSAGRIATVDRSWIVAPNATSTYEVMAAAASVLADEGTVVSATAGTIQLANSAPSGNGALDGAMVTITSGVGQGETKILSNYVGATRTADIDTNWVATPTAGVSTYAVIPTAQVAGDTGGGTSAPTAMEVAAEVLLEMSATPPDVNVASSDDIDFTATQKTSLNAATPASVQNIPVDGTLKVSVNGYEVNQDPATLLLEAPANKIETDVNGYVTANVNGAVAVSDKTGFKLASDGLASVAAPADLANDAASRASFMGMVRALFNRFYNNVTQTVTEQKVRNDTGVVVSTMSVSDDGVTQTKGKSV